MSIHPIRSNLLLVYAAKGFKALSDFFYHDARHFQIVYLTFFLVYGNIFLGWHNEILRFALIFGICISTQLAFDYYYKKPYLSVKSAFISALGLCLLLKANAASTLALAAFLSIASKFFIRIKGKHVFNPANFGIIGSILLTQDAWISPGQWGSDVSLLFILGVLGTFILLRVNRIDTSLAFIITLALLEFFRIVIYLGWPIDFFLHQFTSGTLLLFTFFMITDPVTTPNSPKARIIWASLIALASFGLSHYWQLYTAPIWVLFILSPLTALLDRIFVHHHFNWQTPLIK